MDSADSVNQIFVTRDNAALWASQQFVATERCHIYAGLETGRNHWLVDALCSQVNQASAAQVFIHRDIGFAP